MTAQVAERTGRRLSASQLLSWHRCPTQWRLDREVGREAATSRSVFGVVVHHAVHVFEREMAAGADWTESRDLAVQTFDYYWHPQNTRLLTEPVEIWIGHGSWQDSYGSLRQRGKEAIRKYCEIWKDDKHQLLSLEHPFEVPVIGTPHTISGFVDRLVVRRRKRVPILSCDDWKGLALGTLLPTPTGWTTMGAVRVGDQLFDQHGRPTTVTTVSALHERDCLRVTFDDGTTLICDDEHRWVTDDGVVEARDLRPGAFVPNVDVVQLPRRPLPLDPYVLGVWLGDGTRGDNRITNPDPEVWAEIERRGFTLGVDQERNNENKAQTRCVRGLLPLLREVGLLGHKQVPAAYLRASGSDRLALLQGLMDTDGTWNRTRRQAVFTSCDKALAEAVRELVVSLGVNARLWTLTKHGFGKTVTAYDVTFTPWGFVPFLLPRKADLAMEDARAQSAYPGRMKNRRRKVVTVTPTVTVTTKCITVDSPTETYLCTEAMLPTHNTGVMPPKYTLRQNLQLTVYAYASTQRDFWSPFREVGEDPDELWRRYVDVPRHVNWYDLRDFKLVDAGFRGPADYARLARAVTEMANSIDAGIFPLHIAGETCLNCIHNRYCPDPDGPGLPAPEHGAPEETL